MTAMATDFRAIDDLTAQAPSHDGASPAHFTVEMRNKERKIWKEHDILRHHLTCQMVVDRLMALGTQGNQVLQIVVSE